MNKYVPAAAFRPEADALNSGTALSPIVDDLMQDVFSQIPEPGDPRNGFERDGIQYEFNHNNISVTQPGKHINFANFRTVTHILAGAGLLAVGETLGLARGPMDGEDVGSLAEFTDSSLPTGIVWELRNRLLELEKGREWPSHVAPIDQRDARAALDSILASGKYPEASRVAEEYRNRIFGRSPDS